MATKTVSSSPDSGDALIAVPAGPGRRGPIGWIVGGSLGAGLVAALLLVAAPFLPAEESAVTGAVLLGFAAGWALLAALSPRLTDQPQRWAAAPAVFMAASGALLLALGPSAHPAVDWVWPPALLALAVWMVVQARRHLQSRSRHWLLYPVIATLALASVGAAYETVREAVDVTAYPMPGRLIDVDGHMMHLHCTGSGSPTVVLEAGGGDFSSVFGWIAPAVALDTTVCVYDRAGRGWSDPADGRQDGARIAADLDTLLHRGNVPAPYVLVGHSFGGLYSRIFAARYSDEVAGMVLVDSTAPASSAAAVAADGSSGMLDRVSALVAASARVGLGRLAGYLSYGDLPAQAQGEVRARGATAASVRSFVDEFIQANASREEAASLVDFAGKPLVVLTAGSGHDAVWLAAQDGMAALSTNSAHRVIEGATHASLILNEHDSSATVRAILDVVASVRSGEHLDLHG